MHMRIKYHFLADLPVTRPAWNKGVSGILKTNLLELNQLQAEIVITGPKPHQGTHFLYTIENSPMDFTREAKHRQILPNSNINRGEKLHEVWVIVLLVHGRERLNFQIYVTFSIHFPNTYI